MVAFKVFDKASQPGRAGRPLWLKGPYGVRLMPASLENILKRSGIYVLESIRDEEGVVSPGYWLLGYL